MADSTPITIGSKPGVKRDGTQFEGDFYTDARWCRMQRGLPRKIGGYVQLTDKLAGPPRELEIFSQAGLNYCVNGYGAGVEEFTVDGSNNVSVISPRTPGGFVASPLNDWQFCEVYDTALNKLRLLGVATPSLTDIDSMTTSPIWIGDAYGTAVLVSVSAPPADLPSGGLMALQTYAVMYGSNGLVGWAVSNAPDLWSGGTAGWGEARVTEQKIVKGLPLRGGSNSPAGLLWSLDSLLRMSFIGGAPIWQFDTLSGESSIMGPNTVIEYDGVYYWMGVDRFLMFNGILQDLPNDLNLNFLLDNFTYGVRGKAFAFKIPRYGEIWWCVPLFGATEPNWAIIYNVVETRRAGFPVWYDTPLPTAGRGAAHYAQVNRHPFATSTVIPGSFGYALYAHESGVDEVVGTAVNAIDSFFETADISRLTGEKPADGSLHVDFIEPDFKQTGDMTVEVRGRVNAAAGTVTSTPRTFAPPPRPKEEQLVMLKEQRRELRFRFRSNVAGGDYQFGQTIAHVKPGDARLTGGQDDVVAP